MIVLWRVAAGVLLPLVPTMAVFGNALVVLAVFQDRALQTMTNMLIVSLAISDFMVAICVMSFGVYYEWNGFKWEIGEFFCNLYLASDVICSTASILNLVAISIDRYTAISHPITYAQYGARRGRAVISISIVWGVSTLVGLPILFGVNPMENDQCELGNPYFNILSSLFSFFIPCTAMIILYAVVFKRLRARKRARNMRHANRQENEKISSALLGGARFARQMGRHFKNRTDQILLEISFQTSSFPTISDSSDDISTVTPLPTELNFGPTTTLDKRKMMESESLPVINGNALKESSIPRKKSLEELSTVRSTICDVTLTRSFGDNLEDLLPYIDGGSRKSSKEELNLKTSEIIIHGPLIEEKRMSQSLKLIEPRRITQKQCFSDGMRNGSIKRRVTDMFSLPPRANTLKVNGRDDVAQIHKSTASKTRSFVDFLHADDYSFTDSVRIAKDQLWNRVTGWKTRPSRHMVKKASKQMRREHKATVTLAVVLAVFLGCWLPFFTLHLANSICLISLPVGSECIPMLPLFLTTWLGYLNSSLNPLIYTVFDQRFRRAFRNVLSCGFGKK